MAFEPRATSFSKANAQILAQASAMACRQPSQCATWATVSGSTGPFDFFDNAETQGFVAESPVAIIVAFRGTQPNRPMDWFVGLCHYGGQLFFDHGGKSSTADSAVETVKDALAFAKGAFNLNVLGQAAGLVTDGLKSLITGDFTEEHEKAFRDRATEILKGGIEKIEDHSMDDHYLVRLETKLPPV